MKKIHLGLEKPVDFRSASSGTLKARKLYNNIYKVLRKRKCKPRICDPAKVLSSVINAAGHFPASQILSSFPFLKAFSQLLDKEIQPVYQWNKKWEREGGKKEEKVN